MKINRLQFSIDIKADKSKIWESIWSENGYRDWVSVFYAGSYVITDNWEEGSKVLFLSPDESGIYSNIERHIPNETMHFRHIGSVLKGKEQPIDEATKKWSGATEIYTLTEGTDHNTLAIEIDVMDEHLDYMTNTFPKALERMKELSES